MSKSFIHFLTLLFSPNEYIINLRANMFEETSVKNLNLKRQMKQEIISLKK